MNKATRVLVSALGAIMGVAGIEHGIGETLQGNVAPSGIMIQSWPDSAFFRVVTGEPAMTVVPNLLLTGVLTIIVSLIFLIWTIFLVQRKNGGLVLILLSIVMLLVGGGIFPPILGIVMGVVGTRINAPMTWWRKRLSVRSSRLLGKLWIWSFSANLISWLLLFPGLSVLDYFLSVNNSNFTLVVFLFALVTLPLTVFAGFAHDVGRQPDSHPIS